MNEHKVTYTINDDGSLTKMDKIPEGLEGMKQLHLYRPEGMLKPRGAMLKESIGMKICEELISYYESWTNEKYADNPEQKEVIAILKKNLDDEVAASWKTFLRCINTGENLWDVAYKDKDK